MKRQHYPMFDWLRLFLALEVIVMHAGNRWKIWPNVGVYPFPIAPVQGFIALSGFMIGASLEASRGPAHFWWKRVLRIAPALLASFVLVGALLGWQHVPETVLYWATAGALRACIYNVPLYTLAYEEVFYAALCALFFFGLMRDRRWVLAVTILSTTLPFIDSKIAVIHLVDWLLPCFMIGVSAYRFQEKLPSSPYWGAGLTALALTSAIYGVAFNMHALFGIVVIASALASILLGVTIRNVKSPAMDLSYGIYVYHWPLLVVTRPLSSSFEQSMLLGFGLAIPAAIVSCLLIERPALKLKGLRFSQLIPRHPNRARVELDQEKGVVI